MAEDLMKVLQGATLDVASGKYPASVLRAIRDHLDALDAAIARRIREEETA